MKSKKGALELSMNTIIIIIIGVTILSLGLLFVRGIFNQVESLSKTAFETADAELGEISNIADILTIVPKNIELEQKSATTVSVIMANFEDTTAQFKVTATSTDPTNLDCSFADTMTTESNSYTLQSGQQAKLTLIVDELDGPLGNKVCNIKLETNLVGIPTNLESLFVIVI
ncbi:MAG: hypothetical protein KJ674_03970 [Nanoarchaeota archaeon]|nr:hypothetical protein [Nanoarchaeota archaeon]